MKKLRSLILLQIFCLLAAATSTGQVLTNVVKFHAYVRETVQGKKPVKETVKPTTGVDHEHFLYAAIKGKTLPQWNVVYTNSGTFAVQAEEVKSSKETVGKLKGSGKSAAITTKRGYRLWKLNLVPMKARTPDDIAGLLKSNDVVVVAELQGKKFTHTISKEVQLETRYYE